jgi:hypothetical protein
MRRDTRAPQVRVNERIRAREVRVIDEEGQQLGIMTPQQATDLARQRGYDLVEVAPRRYLRSAGSSTLESTSTSRRSELTKPRRSRR